MLFNEADTDNPCRFLKIGVILLLSRRVFLEVSLKGECLQVGV